MVLQHIYKPVLNFLYDKITYRVSDKTRNIIIFMCFFLIFSVQFAAQYIFEYQGLNRGIRDYFICLMMGIMILFSVNARLYILKWNLWTYIPYTLSGILIFIASLDHEMGPSYQAFPLTILVAFMCLFYVWGCRGDYLTLFKMTAYAYVIYISIIFIMCVLYYPYYESSLTEYLYEYAPFGINPNGVTKLFAPGVACSIFLMILNIDKNMRYVFALIAGLCAAVIILTDSRAGTVILILTALICFFYLISYIKSICTDKEKNMRVKLIGCASAVILLVFAVWFGGFLIKNVSPEINVLITNQETEIQSESEATSTDEDEEAKEADERTAVINERLASASAHIYENETLTKLDVFSAGRVKIWYEYFNNMTWRGSDELMFYDTEYAHNQYIELSYKAGIVTGIVYLIFVLIVGGILLKRIFNGKVRRNKIIWWQLMIYAGFFVISMLDTGIMPFERGFIFLFYISLAPLFIKNGSGESKGKDERR